MLMVDNQYRTFFDDAAKAEEFGKAITLGDEEMVFEVHPYQGGRYVVRVINTIDGSIVRI